MAETRKKFPKPARVAGSKRYAEVFDAKCSASSAILTVYAAPNGLARCRFGFSVGRKFGPAVRRNRAKRLLREAFRLEAPNLPAGYDLVCIPRPGVAATLRDFRAALGSVVRRAVARHGSTRN